MPDLFKEWIPSVLQTKENHMLTEQDEASYPGFMINRALSQHRDTVMLANLMNQNGFLDAKLQYHFLLNTVKPFKRPYVKWHKKVIPTDLEVIKKYYGYSNSKALEIIDMFSPDQLNEMRIKINEGG